MPEGVAFDVTLPLESLSTLDDAVAFARRAEPSGYAAVSMPEATGHNAAVLQAALAAETNRITVTNDVFSPFSRSPALLGQTAATL